MALMILSKWEQVPERFGIRGEKHFSAPLIQKQITHSIHILAHKYTLVFRSGMLFS
jgi:hypothetical protein